MFHIRKLSLLLAIAYLVSSCASFIKTPTTYKTLYLTKSTAELIKDTAIALHETGRLTDEKYEKIRLLYEASRKANDKVIDLMIEALERGESPNKYEAYKQAVVEFNEVVKAFIGIAIESGLVTENDLKVIGGGIIE